jgi:hypothetical protein
MSKAAPDYFDSHQSSVHLGSEEDTTIECDRKGREMKIDIILFPAVQNVASLVGGRLGASLR